MTRRLVWIGGGILTAGALVSLCVPWGPQQEDRSRTTASAPSTPASGPTDPVQSIELSIQRSLLKEGVLNPPGPSANPQEKKAYEYVMDAKQTGAADLAAIRAAAERIWQEKMDERRRRQKDREMDTKERAKLNRQLMEEKQAKRRAENPPPVRDRGPKPPRPELGPAYIPDPDAPGAEQPPK